jgi:HTH domain
MTLQQFVNGVRRLFTERKRPGRAGDANGAGTGSGPGSEGAGARAPGTRFRLVSARHPLLVALAPVAERLGATLVPASRVTAADVPLQWEGELVGGLRLPGVHGTLDRMIAAVEAELGAPLAELSREDKQRAVRLLDERGAFQLRKSVEEVADALSVSRFTVYNYLNAGGG